MSDAATKPALNKAKVIDYLYEILFQKSFIILPELLKQLKKEYQESTLQVPKALILLLAARPSSQDNENNILRKTMKWIVTDELETATKNEVFRENTMSSTTVLEYMKLMGSNYVKMVLSKPINELLKMNPSLEIDPKLVPNPEIRAQNLENLKRWTNIFLTSLKDSYEYFPKALTHFAADLQEQVRLVHGPTDESAAMAKNALVAFIFLRYICLAIVTPHRFDITKEPARTRTQQRNLVLIAKIIQSLANGVPFQSYMEDVNQFRLDNQSTFDEFVSKIMSNKASQSDSSSPDTLCNEEFCFSCKFTESQFLEQCSVFIKWLNNLDVEEIIRNVMLTFVPSVIEQDGSLAPEEIGEVLGCWDKLGWICAEKKLVPIKFKHFSD